MPYRRASEMLDEARDRLQAEVDAFPKRLKDCREEALNDVHAAIWEHLEKIQEAGKAASGQKNQVSGLRAALRIIAELD